MVETDKRPDFTARLDAALAMNDLTNAEFASLVNATSGQQSVNRWKARGRIGQPSVALVRRLLPRTNIDWLQEGTGPAERFTDDFGISPGNHLSASRAARFDVHILSQALGVLDAYQFKIRPQKLRALDAATRLRDWYERIASGEADMADLIARIFNDDEQGKDDDDARKHDDAGAASGRN